MDCPKCGSDDTSYNEDGDDFLRCWSCNHSATISWDIWDVKVEDKTVKHLTFSRYQERAQDTANYPKEQGVEYTALGLAGEAGEVANKVKKVLRGDYDKDALREMLKGEIGDCLWYAAQLATELDLDLGVIAQQNLNKLADRKKRGVIQGDGDNR